MLKNMKDLGVAATATVSTVFVFFLAACDAPGNIGKAYRRAVRNLFYSPMALVQVLAGLTVRLALPLLVRLDEQTYDQAQQNRSGIKYYQMRLQYRGAHHVAKRYVLAA